MNTPGGTAMGGAARVPTQSRPAFEKAPDNLSAPQKRELEKLKGLSKDYESFFMKQVVDAMRKTVPKGSNLNGGNAEEIYKSMLDDQLSSQMAKQGGSGIAESLYNKLSKAYLATLKAQQAKEQTK